MDALELLSHDHRMVEQLFRDYSAAASDQQRRGVVDIAIRELSKHAALEELMVYPLAKQVLPDGDQQIDDQLAGHMEIKKTLVGLDKSGDDKEQTDKLMSDLQKEIEEHVKGEEGVLFPKLRDALDQEALDQLGEALDKGKEIAPTRAHPGAPEEPPALTLAGPVAAIYDRLRDRLQGRPRT